MPSILGLGGTPENCYLWLRNSFLPRQAKKCKEQRSQVCSCSPGGIWADELAQNFLATMASICTDSPRGEHALNLLFSSAQGDLKEEDLGIMPLSWSDGYQLSFRLWSVEQRRKRLEHQGRKLKSKADQTCVEAPNQACAVAGMAVRFQRSGVTYDTALLGGAWSFTS